MRECITEGCEEITARDNHLCDKHFEAHIKRCLELSRKRSTIKGRRWKSRQKRKEYATTKSY